MSTNLARLVEPFVTSVVLGKDVVPRSSVANLGRLIDQMVRAQKPSPCLGLVQSRSLGSTPKLGGHLGCRISKNGALGGPVSQQLLSLTPMGHMQSPQAWCAATVQRDVVWRSEWQPACIDAPALLVWSREGCWVLHQQVVAGVRKSFSLCVACRREGNMCTRMVPLFWHASRLHHHALLRHAASPP